MRHGNALSIMNAIEGDLLPDITALLNASLVRHRVIRHTDLGIPIHSPADVAEALQYDAGRVTKALLLATSEPGSVLIAVLRADGRADLRVLAEHCATARCRMATRDEMELALGLPAGCVSPLAARGVPVLLDAALMQYETLLVGGGRPGVEVEVTPPDLARLCHGEWVVFGQTASVSY